MNNIKVYLLVMFFIGAFSVWAQTPTVLEVGERRADLYYWDTNWVDYKLITHSNDQWAYYIGPLFNSTSSRYFRDGYHFIGRPCITDIPLKVIGVAALVSRPFIHGYAIDIVLDSVLENCWPEYFRLYQVDMDSLYFKAETRWDTNASLYKLKYPTNPDPLSGIYNIFDTILDLYEAYFEKPVIVHDTFVVGGTNRNCLYQGQHEVSDYQWCYIHRPTFYMTLFKWFGPTVPSYPPNPPYYYVRHHWPSVFANPYPGYDGTQVWDTVKFHKEPIDNIDLWLPFFAIFDTDFVYDACMGVATTGLYVEAMDTLGNVTLEWDDSGVEQWQVSVAPLGVEADSGMLYTTPINYLQVMGLDTGSWYVARVRTLCDTDLFGEWSDSVLLYVPGPSCTMPTGLHVVAVDSAMVSLAWDAGTATNWQVERGMCDLGMSNAQTVTTQAPALTVADLPYGNAWYWARVRVVCDSDFWSDWTDTVRFYVPNQHTGSGPDDTTQAINLVEQYTYLMPNPARDEVTVASSFRVKAVELYAADGKLLQQVEVNAVGTTLSLEGLPAGIYFVRVHTSAGVTTKRLVVE